MQGPKLRRGVGTKNTHQQLERTQCLPSPTGKKKKKLGKLVSRCKLSRSWVYAGIGIFILPAGWGGRGCSEIRLARWWKERTAKLPQWFTSLASPDLSGLLLHRFVGHRWENPGWIHCFSTAVHVNMTVRSDLLVSQWQKTELHILAMSSLHLCLKKKFILTW